MQRIQYLLWVQVFSLGIVKVIAQASSCAPQFPPPGQLPFGK